MKSRRTKWIKTFGMLVCLLAMMTSWQSANAGTHYTTLQTATELGTNPEAWQPHMQLYVIGDVPIQSSELEARGKWLQNNRPYVTVVLVEKANGHEFLSAEGLKRDEKACRKSTK